MKTRFLVGLLAIASGGYALYRLRQRRDATAAEVYHPLPGDDLVPYPMAETTHSIVIRATRAAIWPWLVQMGYDRGGWYTEKRWYQWVERTLWNSKHPASADRIIPELQHLKVGNTVPDGPPGTAFFTVADLEPQRALALYSTTHVLFLAPRFLRNNPRIGISGEFSWTFFLEDVSEHSARLTVRCRISYGPRLFKMLTLPLLFPTDFIMARMMLQGIKQRAELTTKELSRNTLVPS